jgi:hypothetical protein
MSENASAAAIFSAIPRDGFRTGDKSPGPELTCMAESRRQTLVALDHSIVEAIGQPLRHGRHASKAIPFF